MDYLQDINFREMKRIRNQLKICSCILIMAILCQSCVVYHKTPANLEQAAKGEYKNKDSFRRWKGQEIQVHYEPGWSLLWGIVRQVMVL